MSLISMRWHRVFGMEGTTTDSLFVKRTYPVIWVLEVDPPPTGHQRPAAPLPSSACWQRCRVHFMRNILSTVTRSAQEAVAALVPTIFAQPDHASAMAYLAGVAAMLGRKFPQAAELLEDAAEDVLKT
jgi:putative transposase